MRKARAALALLALLVFAAPASAAPGLPEESLEAVLELRHPRGLNHFVRTVSDPSSRRYRDYASVEALIARFGASQADQNATLAWLARRGLHGSVGPTGTYVTVPIPSARAEQLLLRRGGAGASASATLGRRVPAGLRGPVTAVTVLSDRRNAFTNVMRGGRTGAQAAAKPRGYSSILPHSGSAGGCAAGRAGPGGTAPQPFTPNQYLSAYGHDAMHTRGLRGEGQTVALVEIDGFRRSDIETFAECFGVKLPPIHTIPVEPLTKPYPGGSETTLDLELLTAAAPGLDHIDVYEGIGNEAGILLTAGTALGSRGHRPDVISISLGICEPQYSGHLVYRRALDNVFAVAAGAGISVLIAAGDSGSSGCRVVTETESTALPIRAVSLPSSSPYVTAVGGTNLRLDAANRIASEIVWNDWPQLAGAGGGGVSLLSPRRPWWQQLPGLERYGLGRIVPDIAALADVFPGYAYFCTSSEECRGLPQSSPGWTSIGGTSAATPLMAAGVALANQFAERHGERPLGFLNPLLYDLGAAAETRRLVFRDVTKGNNDLGALLPENVGGGQPLGCCGARPGYDWASGWGSLKVLGLSRTASGIAP
ncbi:MAG TPA: S53 family peptidase [Solirubrobacterales bacterium]|nr:S53 family peptidase [Solirubrobacterales bacterium]